MSEKNLGIDVKEEKPVVTEVTEKEDEKATKKREESDEVKQKDEKPDQKVTDEKETTEDKHLLLTVPTEEDVLRLLKEVKTATSEIKNIVKIEISLKPESIDVIDFCDLTPDSELYVTSSICSECASEENEKDVTEDEKKQENEDTTVIPSATSKTNETHSTSTETKKRWASIKRLLLFTTSRKKSK